MNAIELNAVNYQYGDFELKDINFHVPKGYVTGFIGSNGVGKTTIIRMIMDLIEPENGEILVFEKSMREYAVELKNKIGFVYSDLYLNEKWTVKKIESYISTFYKNWNHDLFSYYLQKFNLLYSMKIKTLSTGMKMKLSIAIAFSHHAELFILDEPTSGLDPIVRNEVLDIIQQELINEEKTVFISTHIISDLEKIADYLIYIKDGEVVLNNYLDEIMNKYKVVKGDSDELDDELFRIMNYYEQNKTGYVALTDRANVFKEIFGNKVAITRPTIEELMVYLEKGKNNLMHHNLD
ncbi:ABC transporter ATP-binding protein [Staphylococcus sp. ACRSN]|uniref:phenol-soluble modulin export ABC transporter ATP-binding protein PmtA n=1 Tax=Staphylococcus sp. ACRSN TaxID=2918214 RepID=UPI001EF1794A|nr:ABC transporter ATP-binding protein [Staphylococcus sp. ACRSN]MCG7339910.1 ABC transporter ATP-binding protein [Staphylococcus sp. ACRSN]